MNDQVSWHVELEIDQRNLQAIRALTAEMVESARAEPGTLAFERYVDEEGVRIHAYERYVDSAAAVAHLRTFRERFAGRFEALVSRRSFTVFGAASEGLRQVLDPLGARYAGRLDGFSRPH